MSSPPVFAASIGHDTFNEYVKFAKKFSPFYAEAYKNVSLDDEVIRAPVTDHSKYWDENGYMNSKVLTGPHIDGVVLRTGGTTSKPKFTAYTQAELQRIGNLLAIGIVAAGLVAGDRVGNLFYAGDCYGSFLMHILSVMALPVPAVQVPIGGFSSPDSMEHLIGECNVNVLLSTPTTLVKLANFCLPRTRKFPKIRLIMFSGESLFPDQEPLLHSVFPNAKFRSCVYGSVDAGVVAKPADNSDPRVHQVLPGIIAEICTDAERLQFTQENGVEGSLIVTNLMRRLMPVVRYPPGDRAEWVDYKAGIFRLLGRDNHSLRLGPVSIDVRDIRKIVAAALPDTAVTALQAVVLRQGTKDLLQCRVDASPIDRKAAEILIRAHLYKERPMLAEHVHSGHIGEPEIRFMPMSEMQTNSATGKLPEGLDLRHAD